MTERNLLVDIINALKFQKITSDITKDEFDILYQKFISKLSMIDRKLSKDTNGLTCVVCKQKITGDDNVICCPSCGMPFHFDHYIDYIRESGYCPVCGEFFNIIIHDDLILLDQQFLKSMAENLSNKFPRIQFTVHGRVIKDGKEIIPNALYCPECKRRIEKNWVFCKFCGAKVKKVAIKKPEMEKKRVHSYKKCPRCGNQVNSDWKHCKWCGTTLGSV